MKKGEVYEGIIEQIEFPNKGKVVVDGQTVIVKNGMPGQKVRFMINKKRGGRVEARLLEVLEPSPLETRKPVCSIFPQCGGCMYQTMDYSHQLEMKQEQIRRLLDTAIKNGGQVDENGNLRDWTAFCCSNAMSAMVYLKDPANVQDYAKTYAVLQKMAAEGIYGFTTVYTKDETKAMGLDGDFSFVLETDGYTSFSTDWNRPAVRPFDRNDFRYGHATHGYLPEKGPQPTFMAVGPSFRENVWLDSAAMIDEAPTFAALLGVPLPAADGKILQELLR